MYAEVNKCNLTPHISSKHKNNVYECTCIAKHETSWIKYIWSGVKIKIKEKKKQKYSSCITLQANKMYLKHTASVHLRKLYISQ